MKVLLRVLDHSLFPHLHPASPAVLPTRTSSLQSLHLGLERSLSPSSPPAGGISPGTQPPPVPFYRPVSPQAPDVVSTHFLLRDGLWTARWEGLGKRHSAEWVIIFRTWYPQGRTLDPWQFRMSIIIMRNFWYPQLTFLKTELDHREQKENKQLTHHLVVQGFSHYLLQSPSNSEPWEDFGVKKQDEALCDLGNQAPICMTQDEFHEFFWWWIS